MEDGVSVELCLAEGFELGPVGSFEAPGVVVGRLRLVVWALDEDGEVVAAVLVFDGRPGEVWIYVRGGYG